MKFYRGPATDHFDGEHFYNSGTGLRGNGSVLRWLANRKPGPWRKWIDEPPGAPPPERVTGHGVRATFVGHSTVLIQTAGINILCDPIWSMRASPFSWIGPRRHRAPGIRFEDLPPIDIVLQSHDHYDHLDIPTVRRIASAMAPEVCCASRRERSIRAEECYVARTHQRTRLVAISGYAKQS